MKECELCGKSVEKFQRKYKGKGYCSTCYAYLFKKKKCSQCVQDKRIYRYLEPPVCQQCELKDQPCIRCGKTVFSLGKITEDGPVCNSCSKYYRPKKSCSICGKAENNASRRLKYGETVPICDKCFNKKHFVSCCRCKQRVAPFLFDFNRNAYCKPCATKPDKNCKVCGISMHAGNHSNTCYDCHALHKIKRILKQRENDLSNEAHQLYQDYSNWLLNRREPPFTSRQIVRDYEIFVFLDEWLTQKHVWPTYEEYVKVLTVKKSRKHLLTTTFLNEHKILSIDKKTKASIGDLNTITRLLEKISPGDSLRRYIDGYYKEMLSQYNKGKTSARSFRLAMTPAVAMLELGLQQNKTTPDDELIKQYFWLHYGQRAAITGFINFLQNKAQLDLKIPNQNYFQFKRPTESRARIKQKLITMLRSGNFSEELYIKTAIEYFHDIRLPSELHLIKKLTVNTNDIFLSLSLAGKTLHLPASFKELQYKKRTSHKKP